MPPGEWRPPERLLAGAGVTAVRVIEEGGSRSATYDLTKFPVAPEIQRWMARALTRTTGPRGSAKRLNTARNHYRVLKFWAEALSGMHPAVQAPHDLTAEHITAFRARYPSAKTGRDYTKTLRVLLREDPDFPPSARAELFGSRLPEVTDVERVVAYTDGEWQQIMTALRHDVRVARDRIRAGHDLLRAYRAGGLPVGSDEEELGALLDSFARTGDLPRYPSGSHHMMVYRHGGMRSIGFRLCMSLLENTAFCLLLTALTGENFGTVATWPAAHHRPDGGQNENLVALVEEIKPRRGPEREHMVAALEDLPGELVDVLSNDGEHRLFRSPLQVYQLLLELTEVARYHAGSTSAFTSFTPAGVGTGQRWSTAVRVFRWAKQHGFPQAADTASGKPDVHVGRIRQTVIENRRRPVAHTRETMNDHYLKTSRDVTRDSQAVVSAALTAQVAKARTAQRVPVFTVEFLDRARQEPDLAAAEVGLEPEVLKRLMSGEQDTPAAACTDDHASPHAEAGQPCPASFLQCLDCANARALPHHLPMQVAVRDRLAALRPNMDPATWRVRFGTPLTQLDEILHHYTKPEQDRARADLNDRQQRLVDDLVTGRLDVR